MVRSRRWLPIVFLAEVLALIGLVRPVAAQWTVTNLHPGPVAVISEGHSVNGTQQAGTIFDNTLAITPQASVWNGTAASWVNLNPAGALYSFAYETNGSQQVGYSRIAGVDRAGIWSGTAGSWVDLHPATAVSSYGYGISATQQVGTAGFGSGTRASLWTGTAASWVDLSPTGAGVSIAHATNGVNQVGSAFVGGQNRASLWSGSAASWVDLTPAGATQSEAFAVAGAAQAGVAVVGGVFRASLWTGTSASWIDLAPAGAAYSYAYGVFDGNQVGYSAVGGVERASFWSGTSASWFDLSTVLTGSWGNTYAQGIWSDGVFIHVAGYGFNNTSGRTEALLWTRPIPEPVATLWVTVMIAGAANFRPQRARRQQPCERERDYRNRNDNPVPAK